MFPGFQSSSPDYSEVEEFEEEKEKKKRKKKKKLSDFI